MKKALLIIFFYVSILSPAFAETSLEKFFNSTGFLYKGAESRVYDVNYDKAFDVIVSLLVKQGKSLSKLDRSLDLRPPGAIGESGGIAITYYDVDKWSCHLTIGLEIISKDTTKISVSAAFCGNCDKGTCLDSARPISASKMLDDIAKELEK